MDKLTLKNVGILWPNFRGEETQFNRAGNRVFNVLIEDLELAAHISELGWNVKPLTNEDDEIDAYFLPVTAKYESRRPPRVFKINTDGRENTLLDESTVEMLDYSTIENAHVVLNPYEWEVRGDSGVRAYLDTMYVKLEENELDQMFSKPFEGGVRVGCKVVEPLTVGKVYICNTITGEFEEIEQEED